MRYFNAESQSRRERRYFLVVSVSGRDGVPPPSVTPAVADGTATLPLLSATLRLCVKKNKEEKQI